MGVVFFFNDTATTEIYTLSLHDALPISGGMVSSASATSSSKRRLLISTRGSRPAVARPQQALDGGLQGVRRGVGHRRREDRKSTRLNSSHANISYAVFCLKKQSNRHGDK